VEEIKNNFLKTKNVIPSNDSKSKHVSFSCNSESLQEPTAAQNDMKIGISEKIRNKSKLEIFIERNQNNKSDSNDNNNNNDTSLTSSTSSTSEIIENINNNTVFLMPPPIIRKETKPIRMCSFLPAGATIQTPFKKK